LTLDRRRNIYPSVAPACWRTDPAVRQGEPFATPAAGDQAACGRALEKRPVEGKLQSAWRQR
jgi:hypothetical protein